MRNKCADMFNIYSIKNFKTKSKGSNNLYLLDTPFGTPVHLICEFSGWVKFNIQEP
jgi:hypothetical protein